MDLSIIIVSWNVKDLLKKCLKLIFKFQGNLKIEVIVIDNASSDSTSEMIKNDFPQVKLISNDKNLGFAAANNQGIKQATGEYILFLNPDTEILADTLQFSIDVFKKHKDTGAVGCQILNPDPSTPQSTSEQASSGQALQPSVRRFPTFWSQLLILYKIHHLFPNLKTFKHYLASDFDYSKESTVEQIMGAFILTKKEIIDKVGNFDENFYLWFEEVDWCQRLKDFDYKVYYTPKAIIIHYGAQSFNQLLTVKKQKIFNKSMRHYFKKHHGFWPWFILVTAHFDSLFLAWIVQLFKKRP